MSRSLGCIAVPNLGDALPAHAQTDVDPAAFAAFNFKGRTQAQPSADTTPKQLGASPLVRPVPHTEPSFSVTPEAVLAPDCNWLSVRTVAPSDASLSPADPTADADADDTFSRPVTEQAGLRPEVSQQGGLRTERSAYHLLFDAHAHTSSGSPETGVPPDTDNGTAPQSQADGSIGGWPAAEYSLQGHLPQASHGNSFHTIEELAGQFATMQVCIRRTCDSR